MIMVDSLEAQLEDAEASGTSSEIEGFNISEVIAELNKALNESSFYAKSNISERNLRGILRANAFQGYLFSRYGFRITVLDSLIDSKLQQVLSVNGKGRKEIADIISKGTIKAEVKSGIDIADKLFGGSPR